LQHFDYVGSPRNYKWVCKALSDLVALTDLEPQINTIELQRTWEQMYLAYQRNAKTIWIVNVGDIKPLVSSASRLDTPTLKEQ